MSPSVITVYMQARVEGRLLIFTLYGHPRDYPQHYVIRAWYTDARTPEPEPGPVWTYETLDDARLAIPEGLALFTRGPGDDPTIVESYL